MVIKIGKLIITNSPEDKECNAIVVGDAVVRIPDDKPVSVESDGKDLYIDGIKVDK